MHTTKKCIFQLPTGAIYLPNLCGFWSLLMPLSGYKPLLTPPSAIPMQPQTFNNPPPDVAVALIDPFV